MKKILIIPILLMNFAMASGEGEKKITDTNGELVSTLKMIHSNDVKRMNEINNELASRMSTTMHSKSIEKDTMEKILQLLYNQSSYDFNYVGPTHDFLYLNYNVIVHPHDVITPPIHAALNEVNYYTLLKNIQSIFTKKTNNF